MRLEGRRFISQPRIDRDTPPKHKMQATTTTNVKKQHPVGAPQQGANRKPYTGKRKWRITHVPSGESAVFRTAEEAASALGLTPWQLRNHRRGRLRGIQCRSRGRIADLAVERVLLVAGGTPTSDCSAFLAALSKPRLRHCPPPLPPPPPPQLAKRRELGRGIGWRLTLKETIPTQVFELE